MQHSIALSTLLEAVQRLLPAVSAPPSGARALKVAPDQSHTELSKSHQEEPGAVC